MPTTIVTTQSEDETAAAGRMLRRGSFRDRSCCYSAISGQGRPRSCAGSPKSLASRATRVSSPTFTLVQEYRGGRLTLFHVDLVSPERSEELDDPDSTRSQTRVLAIEWAEKLASEARLSAFALRRRDRGPYSSTATAIRERSRSAEAFALLGAVIRRFLGDRDVVHVRFAEAGGRDANQLGLALQLGDRRAAAVAHAGAQAADQLVDHRGDAAFVRDASFRCLPARSFVARPAFEVELVLEVAVAAAAAHRADRAHAAVVLVAAPLVENDLARDSRRCRQTGCRSSS